VAEVAVFSHQDMLHHRPPEGDAERPARLTSVLDALADAGLCRELRQAERVSREDLLRVHDEAYLEALREVAPDRGVIQLDLNTAMSPGSLLAAERACGAVVQAVEAVAAGELQRAFCAVRPPGHHALPSRPMGFCIFSNLAVAAKVAQARGVGRVAVVDFDVHHGNGTEAVFEDAPDLFFGSVHQFPLFPGSGAAGRRGQVVNATVEPGASREAWRAAFASLMAPLDAFVPDLILVSAGFDAHARDPLASLNLEAEDFAWATRAILEAARRHCGGKVVSSLEGGYDLQALGRSAAAHVRALQEE
jgi:acetoin utilization deacetylase AcuC-like enzyme